MLPESSRLRVLRDDADQLPLDALDLPESEIRARFGWAVRQGHPAYLWPDVPIHLWRACLFEIEHAAGQVLSAGRSVELRLPVDASVQAMGVAAFTAGMGPLLGYWLEKGIVKSDPELHKLFALHLEHGRRRAARLKTALTTVLSVLEQYGMDVTVIKSAHTATTYFPEPAVRPAADIDLVVGSRDLRRAADGLEAAGYQPSGWKYAAKSEWLPPGTAAAVHSLELTHAENGYAIDLHDSLDRRYGGIHTARLGGVFELSEPWPELAPNARRLRPAPNAAALALHISAEWHRLQLIRVIELILVLRRDFAPPSPAWGTLSALLDSSNTHRFVYPAFELAERLAPGTVLPELRQQLAGHAHRRLVRVMAALRPSAQQFERSSLDETFLWVDGPWQGLRRLIDLLWPIRARRSDRPIRSIYRERFYRLLRGRFGWW